VIGGGDDEGAEDRSEKKVDKEEDKETNKDGENNRLQALKVKWWVWVILISALLAVSSAGIVYLFFKKIPSFLEKITNKLIFSIAAALKALNVPPLLKASWRLQATSLLVTIGYSYQLYKLLTTNAITQTNDYSPEIKDRYVLIQKIYMCINIS
jgi:hypothetical protein